MRYLTIIFGVVLVLFSLHQAQAKIIHVPGDSSTIQGGIDGAVNGDTVLVAPGTYYELINFNGKAILVTSELGPENTIITSAGPGNPIVTFDSGEDTTSILSGFWIRDAEEADAAILCDNSSPKIIDNKLSHNDAYGAIYCDGTHAIIVNNEITLTSVVGIFSVDYDSAHIAYNLIAWNENFGIDAYTNSYAVIVNNTLDNNLLDNIYCRASSPTIKNNILTNSREGYGIGCEGGASPDISFNDVWNNSAGNYLVCSPGVGDISADPLFCDPDNGNYYLHSHSPCIGAGQGGANMGAFGIGCGMVTVIPGPGQAGPANSQVSVFFYIQNLQDSTDTFDLDVSDQLGWNIEPTHYDLVLDSSQVDTVDFTVSIPPTPIGTVDSIRLDAVSRTDTSAYDWAYVSVVCDSFLEGVEVTPKGDTGGGVLSEVLICFYVENTGVVTQTYDIYVSDPLSWVTSSLQYEITLEPADLDSIELSVAIPHVPLGTADTIGLTAVPQQNPFASDSAFLIVTCNAYSLMITDISDVGNDQGKQVSIEWLSFPGSDPLVTTFSVFRRKDSLLTSSLPALATDLKSPPIYPPGEWQWLVTLPAFGETLYSVVVPTLKDSTITEGMYWSVFFVRAGTENPILYFDSPVDSGYSLDNLSPSAPPGLFASLEPDAIKLTWSPTIASDFDYYTLYRDTLSGFTPDLSNNLGFTIDTTFIDSTAELELGRVYYYLVTATDFSGNESDPSNEAQGGLYINGDANVDGVINSADIIYLINYLFKGGPAPEPWKAGDCNCDGLIKSSDVVCLIDYLFKGGPPPGC